MGDFYVDFRPVAERATDRAAGFLKFYPDLSVVRWDTPEVGIVVTSSDDTRHWAPWRSADGMLWVAVAGRIALEEVEWAEGERSALSGEGGLAAKIIAARYRERGLAGIRGLSGNYVLIVLDRAQSRLHLVTDLFGVGPGFQINLGGRNLGCSSHPDLLADGFGEGERLDRVSLAEFVIVCRVSHPYTYYERVRALDYASETTIAWGGAEGAGPTINSRRYFEFEHRPAGMAQESELADEFAAAFQTSLRKRTLARHGRSAVALSGGLDSRTVLCAIPDRSQVVTFCAFDGENREFRIARSIAAAVGVEFVPFARDREHYSVAARDGVRISAGMGCFASNHFLPFRNRLRELGAQNLLTGCYCDYLFKGLSLNRTVDRWTQRESLGEFSFSHYSPNFWSGTKLSDAVRARLEGLFPANEQGRRDELGILKIEQKRIFPLSYETDSCQRMVPQRVMGWPVPVAERALMDVYLKMPVEMRLNHRLFTKMVQRVCPRSVLDIADANTGARIGAAHWNEVAHYYLQVMERKVRRLKKTILTNESWPNWRYYMLHSPKIRELWEDREGRSYGMFDEMLGGEFSRDLQGYQGRRIDLLLQLFTVKLWMDERH